MKPFFAVIIAKNEISRKKSHKLANKKENFCYNKFIGKQFCPLF